MCPQRNKAKTMTKLSEYMYTAEAAEYLGVHHNTIRKWAARGDIPMHRNPVNGYRLFKRTDLDKLLMKVAKPVKAR
jgi:excisionase family DNA binding protein